jgi:hypothetical protein
MLRIATAERKARLIIGLKLLLVISRTSEGNDFTLFKLTLAESPYLQRLCVDHRWWFRWLIGKDG